METSLSPKIDIDFNNVCGLYIKIENTFPTPLKHKSTVVKYTKLPDHEITDKVLWPQKRYTQIRRFTNVGDEVMKTNRSLKSDILMQKKMYSNLPKRKIITITEDDENDLHPKFSRESKRSCSVKTSNRSVATNNKDEKLISTRNTSRLTTTSKYAKETKANINIKNVLPPREINAIKLVNNRKRPYVCNEQVVNRKSQNCKNKDVSRSVKSSNSSKTNVSKNVITSESEQEISLVKTKLLENLRLNISSKKPVEKSHMDNYPSSRVIKGKVEILKEIQAKNKPVPIIHVPLEEQYRKNKTKSDDENFMDAKSSSDKCNSYKDMNVGTEPLPETVNQVTDTDDFEVLGVKKYLKNTQIQTEVAERTFDSLEIPNVTLIKEKNDSKSEIGKTDFKSIPNIQIPSISRANNNQYNNDAVGLNFCTSYIISRAMLTYTTQQKINFHVIESKDIAPTINKTPNSISYPVSVVSVLKNEKKQNKTSADEKSSSTIPTKRNKSEVENINSINEFMNCSQALPTNKLIKPSDIIRTIRVNTGFLQNEYVCEQFQKELSFIDSFFESLQYLENSSLSTKSIANENVNNVNNNQEMFKNVLNGKNSEYDRFLIKLSKNCNINDTETMTSKSLCLLNSLIRDEQRRSKNLLFVLKMREDALKEFATSQILWLENKKKHDNIDVSVLKKKQRGALLKLQHECGEMQRMRKALLTLSERRKVALMKTKRSLELKLKNNINVQQIAVGRKKLKKNTCVDRNVAPLKCFDLSSSGCEESGTSKYKSETFAIDANVQNPRTIIKSVEKCIQTVDNIIEPLLIDQTTDTAAENCVVVDGGYLNILFHSLLLPQIFSSGKQYEVNEEALKNIVNSPSQCKFSLDRSSSPSTARSLVEEYDQYYKSFEEKSSLEYSDRKIVSPVVYEVKDSSVQVSNINMSNTECENRLYESASTMTSDSTDTIPTNYDVIFDDQSCTCEALNLVGSLEKEDMTVISQTGPLPVPVGASAQTEVSVADINSWHASKVISTSTVLESSEDSQSICLSMPSVSSLTSPVNCEAEELRRQQLAIEREIKALEQQQCQLLVVREIPDKPPPPYTPPVDSRMPKQPRKFIASENTEDKINTVLNDPTSSELDLDDAFDLFLKDFCLESLSRQKPEQSDKPWDSCNLLPQKQLCDTDKLVKETSLELAEVLTGVTPTVVSGVGARRSDHIDDILFTEWRRFEPEWTSLHTDEALVKNQIFDCIFQKILTETVDEYKKIVQCDKTTE